MPTDDYPRQELHAALKQSALDMGRSMEGTRLKQTLDLLVQVRMFEAATASAETFPEKKGRHDEVRKLRAQLFPDFETLDT